MPLAHAVGVFVINGALYWLWSWRARHLREDLLPTKPELRGIGASIVEALDTTPDRGQTPPASPPVPVKPS